MTRGGRGTDRCSDVSRRRRSVPIKTRGVDPREVDGQPLRTMRKTARVNGLRRCVGGGSSRMNGIRGRRRQRGPTNDRSGIAGERMAATGKRDVTSEHCRGQEPQERRPVDHGVYVRRRRLRRAHLTPVHSTGPATPMSAAWCPRGRSRAGASKRRQTSLDRRADDSHKRGPARQPDDPKAAQANTVARFSGSVSERPPNRADVTNGRIGNDPDAQRRSVVNL
jgi:hypothetical protein